MSTLTVKLPRLHIGQQMAREASSRFSVLCCGRRWGKTAYCIENAMQAILSGYRFGWFAPDYKTLLDAYRNIELIGADIVRSANQSEKRMTFITGGIIDFWTLQNKDAGRSRKYHGVVCDEVAIIPNFLSIWNNAILPTLADYGGSAIFASTPKGINDFHTLYQLAETNELWSSYHAPTTQNPFIASSEIAVQRATMSDRAFKQEILAEFVTSDGGVFRHVSRLATAQRQERGIAGHSYIIGIDTAYVNDFTAIVVVDVTTREVVWMDRFNMLDTTIQVSRIASAHERFSNSVLVIERNGAMAVIEQCVARGLHVVPFTTTAQSKPQIIQRLEAAIDREQIRLIDDPILISELSAYESKKSASGHISYEGRPHDDTVMALAIAWSRADVQLAAVSSKGTKLY